jgi:hypothetical protein
MGIFARHEITADTVMRALSFTQGKSLLEVTRTLGVSTGSSRRVLLIIYRLMHGGMVKTVMQKKLHGKVRVIYLLTEEGSRKRKLLVQRSKTNGSPA